MSTQPDAFSIDLSLVPEQHQQRFRLIELPPDLLESITSADVPTLHLKSSPTTTATTDTSAVLTTPDKTYTIRQVSSSNTVFVTQSSTSTPNPTLNAISQPTSTLELAPLPPSPTTTSSLLRTALPLYTSTGHYAQPPTTTSTPTPLTKTALFASTPRSDAECAAAWRTLACFELDGHALVPSARVRAEAWKAFLEAATAGGVDFTSALPRGESWEALVGEVGEWPAAVVGAVVGSFCAEGAGGGEGVALEEARVVRGVGGDLLGARTEEGRVSVGLGEFMREWRDGVPEVWREGVRVEVLEGVYRLGADRRSIGLVEGGAGAGVGVSGVKGGKVEETKSSLGVKRKWHDKFRAAKKGG